jgi:hypothetical protein
LKPRESVRLEDDRLARLGGREAADLSTESEVFPELLNAYRPPGFNLSIQRGSMIRRDNLGRIAVDFAARLYHEVEDPEDPLQPPTGMRLLYLQGRHARSRGRKHLCSRASQHRSPVAGRSAEATDAGQTPRLFRADGWLDQDHE